MKHFAFLCIFSLIAFAGQPMNPKAEPPVVPYDSLMDERVSIDGYLEKAEEVGDEDEYPGGFSDPRTGIAVFWGYDDSLLYVALSAKGKGWLAIGFGSPVMNGANMFIGYYTDDSVLVVNHVGAGYSHKPATGNDSLLEDWEVDYDDETNTTTMEFCYPLNWQGVKGTAISGLKPGETYDLILARNPKSPSFAAKHAQKSTYRFRLAEKPVPEKVKQKE